MDIKMKIIIAGGRKFVPNTDHLRYLIKLNKGNKISEVVSGTCKGADIFGEQFAKTFNIKIKQFPAKWGDIKSKPLSQIGYTRNGKPYWKLAGMHRNVQMVNYADGVILFPGGSGTANMKLEATKRMLPIWEFKSS
jgi:hypothetical protein